jgi:drug/metabolite transporter (DMT)-like permease
MHPLLLALAAALLFGASTPASKLLLDGLSPQQLAGCLYLGAALATAPIALRHRRVGRIDRRNLRLLAAAVILGGVLSPVLLLTALRLSTSGSVALLLNLEVLFTAVLGVWFFREHTGPLGWLGVAAGCTAGAVLSAEGGTPGLEAGLLVAGACVAWALDNHATALIDGMTPAQTTMWKGLVAGSTNFALGLAGGPMQASTTQVLVALGVGTLSYGASILLYITAAQHLGATRAQVAFATAPFLGACLSFVFLGESLSWTQVGVGLGFGASIVLLFRDRHEHVHTHAACSHTHSHRHDDGHHNHAHAGLAPSTRHTHPHEHRGMVHVHRHLPDLHHRHRHRSSD